MRRFPASGVVLLVHCAVVVWLCAGNAAAQTPDPMIVEVVVEQEGKPVTDPAITSLIETKVGQPLSMRSVRETITHLMSLNRYNDAQPVSEPLPSGVRIRWKLFPVHPIDRIEFNGMTGLSESELQRAINERFRGVPTEVRVDEAATVLKALYRRRGYPSATVMPRIVPTHDPDRSTLFFDIQAGKRATILDIRVEQRDADRRSNLVDIPDIKKGQPFDEDEIQRELQRWEERMRERGYYEARASRGITWIDNDAVVFINLTRGPLVKIELAGDPLPQSERDRLVPVREEGTVDTDLLEDSSRAIEAYLHLRGYRDATAPFTRNEPDGELVIVFNVTRGPRYVLRDLRFVGNASIPTRELETLVRLKNGEPFVREALDAGRQAIVDTYRLRGFTQARVKPSELVSLPEDLSDPDRGIEATLTIEEGSRTTVRNVTFQGNKVVSEADLQRLTVISPGRAYVAGEMNADRERIGIEYRNRGYESVAVTTEVTFEEKDTRADVRFTISEGPQILVDHIIINGNRRTSTRTIERELLLREGEPLGEAALAESRARLYALNLFRRATIEPVAHGSEPRRDVVVQVEEAPPTVYALSGGIEGGYQVRTGSTGQAEDVFEVAPRGSFEIGRRNLFGKNRRINLFTRVSLRSRDELRVDSTSTPANPNPVAQSSYGFHEYRVMPSYTEPRVFGPRSTLQVQGILEQVIRTSYNFSRREIRAQADVALAPRYSLTGFYSIQRIKLFDITDPEDKPLIDRLFPSVRLSKFTGSIARDTRDDILDPSLGTQTVISGDVAARAIGSEVGFVRTYIQGFAYRRLPVQRRTVLALGGRVGLAHGFPRTVGGQVVSDLPASERFFAGGDTSVRGFPLDRLVNEDTVTPTGFPTGGNGVVIFNSELRVDLFGKLQGVGFVDAGNVFVSASDLSVIDLRPAAGIGVMYRSPFGAIRLDLGFNLDPRRFPSGVDERGYVVHFLLGQPF